MSQAAGLSMVLSALGSHVYLQGHQLGLVWGLESPGIKHGHLEGGRGLATGLWPCFWDRPGQLSPFKQGVLR